MGVFLLFIFDKAINTRYCSLAVINKPRKQGFIMNNFFINIKNKAILTVVVLVSAINACASEISDSSYNAQIQDSLSRNKKYQKFLKTAQYNAPKISELDNKINFITLNLNQIKSSFKQDKLANMNRKYTIGKFFLPNQIDLINRELEHEVKILTQTLSETQIAPEAKNELIRYYNELLPITSKTSIEDLRVILLRLGLHTQQLPLYGEPVVVSVDKNFDLTHAMCWRFIQADKNDLYSQYKFELKHLNDAPTNNNFSNMRGLLEKYQQERNILSVAKNKATQIENSVANFFYSK